MPSPKGKLLGKVLFAMYIKKCSVAKCNRAFYFNYHEVIPQLPEGQHHDAQHHIIA